MYLMKTAFRYSMHVALALLLAFSGACDDDDGESAGSCKNGTPSCAVGTYFKASTCTCEGMTDAGPDASPLDSGTTWTDAGVECCKPSARPGCCMTFGGAKSNGVGSCGTLCDGMPVANDPAWRLVDDALGCPTWSYQGAKGACCGAPPPPADASTPVTYSCYGDLVPLD